jgi:hypothetical protein
MKISRQATAACAASLTILLAACSSSSDDAAPAVTITAQPVSASIAPGSNSVLSVVAKGTGLTYQWYKDGAAIADATNAVHAATAAGSYYVVVTSPAGTMTSATAVVTEVGTPIIVAQPASALIQTGTTQALAVEASGAGLNYQWYKDGAAISGATAATYDAGAAGSYTVQVSNSAGAVTSGTAVISTTAIAALPAIATPPASRAVNAGTSATLAVEASGPNLAYQWYKDGNPIVGATGATYRIDTVSSVSAGSYSVVVKNQAGSVTSASAVLSVNVLSTGANTAAVVNAANAFLATLSDTQKTVASSATDATTVLFAYTLANANQWTNLPGDRHGLRLNTTTLSSAQLAAADTVIASALSARGIALMNELRAADDVLANAQVSGGGMPGTGTIPTDGTGTPPAGGTMPTDGTGTPPTGTTMPTDGTGTPPTGGYGAGQYSIAFVGTPSKSTPWMLQLIGHHLAYNITYNATQVSATPNFIGVEPPDWNVAADGTVTTNNTAASAGRAHAPMERQRKAVYDLAEAIQSDSAGAAAAKLSGTFTDVLMGASGNSDGNFKTLAYPTGSRGLQYSAMNATQKAYVRAAIEAWVGNQAHDVASTLLAAYLADDALNNTWVAYAVGQNGTKADFAAYPNAVGSPLEAQHSYIRIDGPRVWIEFVVQQGVVFPAGIHYHTIWRDKTADYGGSF